ncbi:hypothetical protein ACNOYE_01220 [Nannocystaceae bacterium ST9]
MRRQRDSRPSARHFAGRLASLVLVAASGCLLDPLKIGPGDEFSDEGESGSLASDTDVGSESLGLDADSESSDSGSTTDDAADSSDSTDTGTDECAPQGALPEDSCETLLGFYWDGGTCLALSGCSCGGECPPLFPTDVECWLAHLSCGPSPCAGIDEGSCLLDDRCTPRYARPLLLDIDTTCASSPIYAGCGLATVCAMGSTYACPDQDPTAVHQFADVCLPEIGWTLCNPPQPAPIADCP